MDNIFTYAARCLHNADIEFKLAQTEKAWTLLQQGRLSLQLQSAPEAIGATRFPERPQLLEPQAMPRRKFTTTKGISAFFHAIAHIEFIAIYLAWDMLYRFRGMPDRFYQDWLQVAYEESQHFQMLRDHLRGMQCDYGALPAHQGLWDIAEETDDDILARLALVPRYLEARGLDVTPAMIDKFEKLGDNASVALLQRILTDEVGHVQLGCYWFDYVCRQRRLNPESSYRELVLSRLKGKPKGPFNKALRLQAGFSEAEITWLESLS